MIYIYSIWDLGSCHLSLKAPSCDVFQVKILRNHESLSKQVQLGRNSAATGGSIPLQAKSWSLYSDSSLLFVFSTSPFPKASGWVFLVHSQKCSVKVCCANNSRWDWGHDSEGIVFTAKYEDLGSDSQHLFRKSGMVPYLYETSSGEWRQEDPRSSMVRQSTWLKHELQLQWRDPPCLKIM